MLHKKQKALTKNHKKAPPLQRPKPHHLMKCEKGAWRSYVPFSHFGGRGGTSSPHKKKLRFNAIVGVFGMTRQGVAHHFSFFGECKYF